MSKLQIHYEPLEKLIPADRNARTHSKKQIRQLATAIKTFGFRIPIQCDRSGRIVAGHGRVEAAKLLGIVEVPVIVIDDLTPEQLRLFAIAENKLSESGGFSAEILSLEFAELATLDLGCDLTVTGFDAAEIDLLLGDDQGPAGDPADDFVAPDGDRGRAVSKPGDIWQIGAHRIICGDSRDPATYAALLGDERVQMVITDPPYNLRASDISGQGSAQHPDFMMAAGEMSPEQFTAFLAEVIKQLVAFSVDGSIHYLFMDYRHMAELLAAGSTCYSELKSLCVWTKPNAGLGSLYRGQHELVFVYKSGKASHINNIQLGRYGRSRSNVWRYAGMNSFGKGRDQALATHATVKPVQLVADALLDCSERGGLVLDAFLGSGTTLVAAHRTGRRGVGIELDPIYVDAAVARIAKATGAPALLVSSGESFEVVRARRTLARAGEQA